jgi:GDP-L-fucose synthase
MSSLITRRPPAVPGLNRCRTAHGQQSRIDHRRDQTARGRQQGHDLGDRYARREFLHVDDCADALVFLLRHYSGASTINVGVGRDVTIAELASVVAGVVGFTGQIGFDPSRPDGTPRKLLDVSRLTALGWRAHTELKEGIASTYRWLDRELARGGKPRGFSQQTEHAL